MNSLINLELETGRGVIQNTEAICWTQGTLSRDNASKAGHIQEAGQDFNILELVKQSSW